MERPSVAWLGLGRMGTVMAGRLLDAGFEVGVWNRTPEKTAPLVARGAKHIGSPAGAAAYDIAYSMILDADGLARLHDPADGVVSGAPGRLRTWIDGSTVSPGAAGRASSAAGA